MGRFGFVQNRFQETFVTFLSLHKLWMAAPTIFSFASFYYAECWDFPDSLAAMVSVWPGSGQLHVSERSRRAIVIYFIVIVCVVLDVEPRDSHMLCKGSTAQLPLESYNWVFKKAFAKGPPQLTCHFNLLSLFPLSSCLECRLPAWRCSSYTLMMRTKATCWGC